jgi:putative dimethyl sulfoxide reductase chaperone
MQPDISPLTPAETALARHHTYTLLGRLYAKGLTAELLPHANELLGELLYTLPTTHYDPNEAAATHHTLFRFNIFPYQAIFRDASGLLGGVESERVRSAYQASGFETAESDHIAAELHFLAFLCAAEAEARQDGLAEVAAHCQARQAAFLGDHLLTWLPPFVIALERSGQPFYAALATLTLDFVADHAATTVGAPLVADPDLMGQAQGRPPQEMLAYEKTSLKDIARYLITPAHSGLYLSRDAIGDLARAHDLPRGFGGRQQMLSNLLYTAVQYDSLPLVLTGLGAVLAEWHSGYTKIEGQYDHLAPFLTPWQAQLAKTAVLLQNMQAAT